MDDMKDIIEVIVELSRMQGQAIDRAQAEAINTAVEKAYDEVQTKKQQDNE
jgi:diacylglycerol kinase